MCFRFEKPCEPHGQQGIEKSNSFLYDYKQKRPRMDFGTVTGVEPASINTPELSQATRLCQHDTPLYC